MSFRYTLEHPDIMMCDNYRERCYKEKAANTGLFIVYPVYPVGKPNPTSRWYCSWECLIEDAKTLMETVRLP